MTNKCYKMPRDGVVMWIDGLPYREGNVYIRASGGGLVVHFGYYPLPECKEKKCGNCKEGEKEVIKNGS